MKKAANQTERKTVRCAIYTRKSTDEGLDQEFNSLDAQREAAEAFIKSQVAEGWVAIPDNYDDGGFSGGNMDRPAMKRLMADVQAGEVDAIVVYKVDRLSRSLMDFSRIMETLDAAGCSFVSVTQQFNTTHSMGRLTLNILLSFAQFEREIISERTRDKMSAARKKGKWVGGHPFLGYDIDHETRRLVVNPQEAEVVRGIFEVYREKASLLDTLREVNARGWERKRWLTRANQLKGGGPWDKNNLYSLLTNISYSGRVAYGGEVYPGEHAALVDEAAWEQVQAVLKANGKSGSTRTPTDAALRGILYCAHCNAPMLHSFSVKHGTRRYRYYSCMRGQKRGKETCPTRALPAGEIENFVAERIRAIGSDPALLGDTAAKVQSHVQAETRQAEERLAIARSAIRQLQSEVGQSVGDSAALEVLTGRLREAEQELKAAEAALGAVRGSAPTTDQIRAALQSFAPLWDAMTVGERARSLSLVLERVAYDGEGGTLAITFRPGGFRSLSAPNGANHHDN
jgi:site-specific DNA recombinase